MTTMLRPSLAGDKGLEMRSVAELLRLPWLEPWMTAESLCHAWLGRTGF